MPFVNSELAIASLYLVVTVTITYIRMTVHNPIGNISRRADIGTTTDRIIVTVLVDLDISPIIREGKTIS